MEPLMPEKWQDRLKIKDSVLDPLSSTLMPTLPWYHAYWNEDRDDRSNRVSDEEYTDSETYRSPELMDEALESRGISTAVLMGHEIKFLSAVPTPDYTASLASAYNELLHENWLEGSDRLKGAIVLAMNNPTAAVEEIHRYADNDDMVTALIYSGTDLPLGHEYYEPIYAAAEEEDVTITIITSGNMVKRQTSLTQPDHYVTFDSLLPLNHMSNMTSMVFQGIFDKYPDLDIVWGGEGVGWILPAMWRTTRYYRNFDPQVPYELEMEPMEYIERNCYVTTYSLGQYDSAVVEPLFDMIGYENILFGSGYPHWNADGVNALPDLSESQGKLVLSENARKVYAM
jgi:predicted TIM-barrel fold metal-dependent hydrolase